MACSREGQILTSLSGFDPQTAATLIAAIGNIRNFPDAAALKAYLGWAPHLMQTGTSRDSATLSPAGTRATRWLLYIAVGNAIQKDCEWARLYHRLLPKKCAYDERKREYVGKAKVMGRVAGQMIKTIYALLMQDAELLATVPPDMEPPAPKLYDPAIHKAHVAGDYVPTKQRSRPARIMRLPKRTEE